MSTACVVVVHLLVATHVAVLSVAVSLLSDRCWFAVWSNLVVIVMVP